MTTADRIPLTDELDTSSGLGVGGLKAILSEITTMLQRLMYKGEEAQIDLRSLPLASREYASLKALLGEGEARIELNLGGLTLCRETSVPAVWWVEHYNNTGTLVAEFIEVAEVPHILSYEADELQFGIASLTSLNRHLEKAGNSQEESDYE